jgi:electron transfer flavoprotein alpha subunit
MPTIVTFAEVRDGKVRRPSLEAVSEARRLAGPLGATVQSGLDRTGGGPLAAEVASYGADRVHVFDDAELASYATEAFARALAQVVTQEKPAVVLIPYTAMGKDVAPRCRRPRGRGPHVRRGEAGGQGRQAGGAAARVRGQGPGHRALEGEPQMADAASQRVRPGDAGRRAQHETVTGAADVSTRRARVQSVQAAARARSS